jgi:lactate dehydrogenase-like 2-hydroxyacid dehydrogenase
MKVRYYNRNRLSPEDEDMYGVKYCSSLKELLSVSDVISVNCPLNANTRGLIGNAEFAYMKDGSFLVNTARGPIVEEEALIEAVKSGKIARAGLDVCANEPNIKYVFFTCEMKGIWELIMLAPSAHILSNVTDLPCNLTLEA